MHPRLIPVILAGGSGERLWPLSTRDFPKQFMTFDGHDHSLFQQTLLRVSDRSLFAAPMIVCNDAHRFIVTEQLSALGCEDAEILVEPRACSTMPALLLAALHAESIAANSTLLVLPADHVISEEAAFLHAVKQGVAAAYAQWHVTFACTPTSPETGYGYIKIGAPLEAYPAIHRIAQFTEKPDHALAQAYLADGGYGWNSGMFMFGISGLLAECKEYLSPLFEICMSAYEYHTRDLGFIRPDATVMESCPVISIDYALMEKTQRGAVIPVSMGWQDLGSWAALQALREKDAAGNSIVPHAILRESSGCHVHSDGPLVAAIGLRDLVVVATDHALLIAPKDRLDEMKPLLQDVAATHGATMHRTGRAHRPWGNFRQIDQGAHYQVKKLQLKPGGKISLQSHQHRAEHWVVVEGRATVTNGDDIYVLERHQSTFIPAGAVHRLENREPTPLVVIEIQTGDHVGEEDITRLEDAYNRN